MSREQEIQEAAASLRVVRGSPDEAELAALVAGMVAAAAEEEDEPGSPTSAWMDRQRTLRGRPLSLSRGDASWRHSLR